MRCSSSSLSAFLGLPRLAHLVRPALVALPTVDRVVDRRALRGGLTAHVSQPFPIGLPALLILGRLAPPVRGGRAGSFRVVERRTKPVGLLAHQPSNSVVRTAHKRTFAKAAAPGTGSQSQRPKKLCFSDNCEQLT